MAAPKKRGPFSHRLIEVLLHFLTCMSIRYTGEPARLMLRSSGLGRVRTSVPGISRVARSSQTVAKTCSTKTSRVFGPVAARRCFSYGEAVPVEPVVQYFGDEKDGHVLLKCGLGREEVVALGTQMSVVPYLIG